VVTPRPAVAPLELVGDPVEARFAPTGKTAKTYGERRPTQLTGLEARVIATLRSISTDLGRGHIRADAAAMAMARDVCLGLAPYGPPPSRLVNFAMESNGLTEPPPHFVVANVPHGVEAANLGELEQRFREILGKRRYRRVGVAYRIPKQGANSHRLLVALMESRVTLIPIPRRLVLGQETVVVAQPEEGVTSLQLVVADPKGKISTTPLQDGQGRFSCLSRGVYQVELTGEAEYGPEVVANFPVYCDRSPPTEVRYSLSPGRAQKAEDLERALLRRTNEIRLEHGLPVFRPNLELVRVARAHSVDMRDNGFVGHVSPSTGTPSDRLRKAGITHLLARENVALGYNVEEIMSGLMNSPAHRENLLSKDITEVGVGVAPGGADSPNVVLVTQDFIKSGTALAPSSGTAPVLAEVARLRGKAGVKQLTRDAQLEGIAAQVAEVLAEAGEGAEAHARKTLNQALDGLGGRFKQVDSLQAKLSALEALAQAPELVQGRYTHMGVAMGGQAGKILLIVLLGVQR
jgi:uncharacterized protein YkwD